MKQYSSRIRAVRGATTVNEDTPEVLRAALRELLTQLTAKNRIDEADVLSVFLTLTPDIHSASPARIARELLDWQHTAIMSAVEPEIEGLPTHCIRVLIQFYEQADGQTPQPLYLNGARGLRSDLT